jgi:hypothetical protein
MAGLNHPGGYLSIIFLYIITKFSLALKISRRYKASTSASGVKPHCFGDAKFPKSPHERKKESHPVCGKIERSPLAAETLGNPEPG